MRARASVWTRLQRLDAVHRQAELLAEAGRVAAELGISAEQVLAEATALRRRMQAAGVVTPDQQRAFLVAESGISEEELRTELTRIGSAR